MKTVITFCENRPIVIDIFDVDNNFQQRIVARIEEIDCLRNILTFFARFDHQDMQRFFFSV